ncbi:MAG: metallophosphoesterase family protein [Alphaproteobacteria bacterium]
MLSLLNRSNNQGKPDCAVPEGERIYAVGDIHGRVDLLSRLMWGIEADMRSFTGERMRLVFLGDYVDRGPKSRETLDKLLEIKDRYEHATFILGNHEEAMLNFLQDPKGGDVWLDFGGLETLDSYGVAPPNPRSSPLALESARDALQGAVPEAHIEFLEELEVSATYGDYFFVHAGVRPGIALESQDRNDLLWIREEFLSSDWSPGKIIVHGHTPGEKPALSRWRIGVDTGAYATGRLTSVVLEGTTRRFLSTRSRM